MSPSVDGREPVRSPLDGFTVPLTAVDASTTDTVAPVPTTDLADVEAPDGAVVSQGVVLDVPAETSAREEVTCPGCGNLGLVDVTRREASDFCATCDYPLFWVPSQLVLSASASGDGALRRLPGTVGRDILGALPCPTCNEPNIPTAIVCVRCGNPMHPVEVIPEPEPEPVPAVVVAEPEPVVEPKTPWWPWALLVAALLAIVVLVILLDG